MDRTLYLFVTSRRPDQYLNAAVHCILQEQVTHIVFIHIVDLSEDGIVFGKSKREGIASMVKDDVRTLLDCLAKGKYRFFDQRPTVRLEDVYPADKYPDSRVNSIKSLYERCRTIKPQWESDDIFYHDLRGLLSSIRQQENDAILDVTALNKRFMGDLVAAGITGGIRNVCTFDLRKEHKYEIPWTMLIHDLESTEGDTRLYEYINILQTPICRSVTRKIEIGVYRKKFWLRLLVIGFFVLVLAVVTVVYFACGGDNTMIQLLSSIGSVASIFGYLGYLVYLIKKLLPDNSDV